MCKFFYNLLINSKLSGVDLFKYIDLAKRYEKVRQDTDHMIFSYDENGNNYHLSAISDDNPDYGSPIFIKVTKGPDVICAFYQNLMFSFHFDSSTNDRIVRIYVKRPEDEWTFGVPNNETGAFDVLHPLNVEAEVFITYDINVLRLNRCFGQNYQSGVWNKMFYWTLCSFIDKTQGLTEISRIKKAYER